MAVRLLNTLLTIMLAALISGCGRSSSNDRPSGGEQIPDDEAVESIISDSEVTFDECTLDDYAHSISRGEDIDDVQLAYMLMHCKAAAIHLNSIIDGLKQNQDAADSFNVLSELAQARWLDDYKYIVNYLNSMSLPSDFKPIINEIVNLNDSINLKVKSISKQQGLQPDLLYAI